MLSAEMILGAIKLVSTLVNMGVGTAQHADGSTLTQEQVDAAYAKADAPFKRIEDRSQAELDKLNKG